MRFLAALLATALAHALAGCDSGGPGGEGPPPDPPPADGTTVAVTFQPNVTDAMRAGVEKTVSASEAAGPDAAEIAVPDPERRPVVLAVNGEGWALLAGRATAGGAERGPAPTALVLA